MARPRPPPVEIALSLRSLEAGTSMPRLHSQLQTPPTLRLDIPQQDPNTTHISLRRPRLPVLANSKYSPNLTCCSPLRSSILAKKGKSALMVLDRSDALEVVDLAFALSPAMSAYQAQLAYRE